MATTPFREGGLLASHPRVEDEINVLMKLNVGLDIKD
jgi:hypothetical protein